LLPRPPDPGWCEVHGVPVCVEHHPELAQVKGKPRLPAYDTAAALKLLPRAENDPKCKLHERRIQFASAEAAEKARVAIAAAAQRLPTERPLGDYVVANGEVCFDPTRVARVSAALPGRVWRVERALGDPVRKGEVLALVDAAEVGKAKGEFLQALAQAEL